MIVAPVEGGTAWRLTGLLGRSMGSITERASHQFTICPEGHALKTMARIQQGPHALLDAVLAEIENDTRAFAGAIPPKLSPRRRLIAFQWRCAEGEALGVTVTPSVARCCTQRS